jgi:hypothetical protein
MEKRAEKLNFTPIAAEEIFYILVPGYSKPGQVTLANPSGNARPAAPTISPEYTQSLMDWIRERVFDPGSPLVQEVDRE